MQYTEFSFVVGKGPAFQADPSVEIDRLLAEMEAEQARLQAEFDASRVNLNLANRKKKSAKATSLVTLLTPHHHLNVCLFE